MVGEGKDGAKAGGQPSFKSMVVGRWELSFVNHKKLPFPFYLPTYQTMLTFSQEGPIITIRTAVLDNLHVTLATFNIISTSTAEDGGGSEGVLQTILVEKESDKKRYQLVVSTEEDVTVLAVRSEDGEALWLFNSIEDHMRKVDENKKRFAREIMDLVRAI